MHPRRVATVLALCGAAWTVSPACATTIAPPQDLGELLRMSDAVVYAEALESWSEAGRDVPLTVTRFVALRSVSGAPLPWTFEVEEVGGEVGGVRFAVEGSPRYRRGANYLLFLDRAPNLRWRSRIMAYGLLVEDRGRARLQPLPEARGLAVARGAGYEPPAAYRRDALLDHLESVAKGARWDGAKVRDIQAAWEEIHDDPPNCQWLLAQGDSLPFRVFGFESGGSLSIAPTTPGQTGIGDGGVGAVQAATGAWSNDPGSNINYLVAATHATTISCSVPNTDVASGEAVFNDPCGDIADLAGCTGTLGFGGAFSGGPTQTFHGEQWHPITAPYMVVNNGAQCLGTTGFNEMMAHELGHSLGFGHHTDSDALMDGLLHNPPVGPVLNATDQACAAYAYPENAAGNAIIRRAEFAALILRPTFPLETPSCNEADYADVTCGVTPYANYISSLKAKGITAGCNGGNTDYCPFDVVTRAQAAKLWLNVNSQAPGACASTGFSDVGCGDPFGPYIRKLSELGWTDGCNAAGTLFSPNDALTWDQLAKFITRAGYPAPPGTP
jgi:hypothetical protein